MSNITNNSPVVTEEKLTEFYEDIKPYLGCPAYVTQEGDAEYYSTDEKVIGRWTDGKPLYQKTLTIKLTKNTGTTDIQYYPHNIANVDLGFVDGGYVIFPTTKSPINSPNATNNLATINVSMSSTDIGVLTGVDRSAISIVVFVRYTKTTDSAATTIEQKPTHYSTDEQVVGTWIDGKPIYQKTYKFNTVSTSNSLGMTINPENVINFFGTVVNSENQCQVLNCQHPNYQDRYGILTYLTSTAIEMRSINGYEWSLSNLRSLKITLQYTKDTD